MNGAMPTPSRRTQDGTAQGYSHAGIATTAGCDGADGGTVYARRCCSHASPTYPRWQSHSPVSSLQVPGSYPAQNVLRLNTIF